MDHTNRKEINHNIFSEKLTKFYMISGLILLLLYCTGIIKYIPHSFFMELAFVILCYKIYYEMIKGCRGRIKRILLYTVCGFLFAFIIAIICSGILEPLLYSVFGHSITQNSNQDYLTNMIRKNPIMFPILVSVFGPIIEETMYRFVLFRVLYDKNHFAAHFITALLFGTQHIFAAVFLNGQYIELLNIISYMLFSLILTTIYSKCRNLLPCILIHIMINTISVLITVMK